MPALVVHTDHSSVEFVFESAETVAASFADAVRDLAARAALSAGTVAWSTLEMNVDVATVSESRPTEKYQRVTVGRSTLTVTANVILGAS